MLDITTKCNLRCPYCFRCKNLTITNKTIIKKSIQFLILNNILLNKKNIQLTLFGGEPTLKLHLCNFALNYLIKEAEFFNLKYFFYIISNGMIFNYQLKRLLLKQKKYCGKIGIQLSFDGIPKIQEKTRISYKNKFNSGQQMEKNLKKIIKFAKIHNIDLKNFQIHCVISKYSLPYLFESYKYFFNKGFSPFFGIAPEEKWTKEDVQIYKEQFKNIFNFLKEKHDLNLFKIKLFKYNSQNKKFEINFPLCGAGKGLIHVTTNGDVYPCSRIADTHPEWKCGNILDFNTLNFSKGLKLREQPRPKQCKDCSGIGCRYCFACQAQHELNPIYCEMRKVEEEYSKKAQELIKQWE